MTGHGFGDETGRAGVDAVSIEVDKLQIVVAREESTGCRVARHACTIGTNRAQIERRSWENRAWRATVRADRGGTVTARMNPVRPGMTSSLVTAVVRVAGAGATDLTATIVTRGAVTGFVAVTGLVVGSFLNVVVYRVPRRLSVVTPPSFCPHCDTRVRPIDNVPVLSWLVLRGKCHACRGRISIRYPLVELATALVFAAVGWGLGPHWAVPGFCVLAATLVALVAVEGDGLAPPLAVAVIGTGIAIALLIGAGAADRRWAHVAGLIIAVVVAAVAVILGRRARPVGTDSWTGSLPVLLPAAAALGMAGTGLGGRGGGHGRRRPARATSRQPPSVARRPEHLHRSFAGSRCGRRHRGGGGCRRGRRDVSAVAQGAKAFTNPRPVGTIPRRSSMTFRSWGLEAAFMASRRSTSPLARSCTRAWSKVCMP